jgi:hypothetical protein
MSNNPNASYIKKTYEWAIAFGSNVRDFLMQRERFDYHTCLFQRERFFRLTIFFYSMLVGGKGEKKIKATRSSLQKSLQIATCILTRVQCRTRVKQFDTCILTRVSDVDVINCTF